MKPRKTRKFLEQALKVTARFNEAAAVKPRKTAWKPLPLGVTVGKASMRPRR